MIIFFKQTEFQVELWKFYSNLKLSATSAQSVFSSKIIHQWKSALFPKWKCLSLLTKPILVIIIICNLSERRRHLTVSILFGAFKLIHFQDTSCWSRQNPKFWEESRFWGRGEEVETPANTLLLAQTPLLTDTFDLKRISVIWKLKIIHDKKYYAYVYFLLVFGILLLYFYL